MFMFLITGHPPPTVVWEEVSPLYTDDTGTHHSVFSIPNSSKPSTKSSFTTLSDFGEEYQEGIIEIASLQKGDHGREFSCSAVNSELMEPLLTTIGLHVNCEFSLQTLDKILSHISIILIWKNW